MWDLLKIPGSKSKKEEQKLTAAIRNITGFTPSNLALYKLAGGGTSRAKETNGFRESNERLEYLGDAVLGAAVADYLFKKYPFKDEGFLTEIRSRMVNRDSLNQLARKLGINHIVLFDQKNIQLQQVVLGNTLEAIIGAVYLDKGYLRCKKFVIDKLIQPHFDLEVVVQTNTNHKSRVIEWTQRQNKSVRFETIEVKKHKNQKEFAVQIFIDDEPQGTGYGYTKKKAEQDAAMKTCEKLNIS
ncbi:MAG: ribonuclease III [Cyclobacteriaceae bacterium]|nr:ribonuclease III [Cyclobacteriaceae bacterium]